jgi:outer membrane cobalamin receptor
MFSTVGKIEIVKGPGSVIYGSGAISGIINLVSAEPFGSNSKSIQVSSGYGSNNNEFLELMKLCHKSEEFGISLSAKYRKTGEMVYGSGEIADNSNVEDRDISLNTGYKFSDKHKIFSMPIIITAIGVNRADFNGPTKRFTKIRNKERTFMPICLQLHPERLCRVGQS